jgi:hypothetical protein
MPVAADSNSVTPINVKTEIAGKPIKVQTTFDSTGHMLALTPNGKTLLVLGTSTVTPINTVTNKAGKPVKVSGPSDMAITPPASSGLTGHSAQGMSRAEGILRRPR